MPKDLELDKIINSIIIHRQGSENGNYRIAYKHIKSYTKEICKILDQDKSPSILTELLKNEHPEVRSMAAYFMMPFDKKRRKKNFPLYLKKKTE